jgi:predicted chitinase
MATLQQALKKVAPQVDGGRWAPALAAGFAKFGLNTNKRVAAAVGQFLSEAGSAFQELEEHLYYTHAERLHAVFPKEFATVAAATPYLATNGCPPKADKWDISGITLAVNGKAMRGAAQRLADSHAMLVALS